MAESKRQHTQVATAPDFVKTLTIKRLRLQEGKWAEVWSKEEPRKPLSGEGDNTFDQVFNAAELFLLLSDAGIGNYVLDHGWPGMRILLAWRAPEWQVVAVLLPSGVQI